MRHISRERKSYWVLLFLSLILCAEGVAGRWGRVAAFPGPQSKEGLKPFYRGGEIVVDVQPLRGEGYIDMALRISNQPKNWRQLKTWNRNRRFPQYGRPIRVTFDYLKLEYRSQAVRLLFPKDALRADGWHHRVTFKGESIWFLAELFTGAGSNYIAVLKANNLKEKQALSIGRNVLIPISLLSEEFGQVALPSHPDLSFEKDEKGKLYAVYELKKGEALYSAVVVRFTGRLEADDVNRMAEKILRLNGLKDPTKIPAGEKIRIPFEDLSDDFVTGGAPVRVAKVEPRRSRNRMHVILDPGHGGSDPGTRKNGLTEDELTYDVMLRLKRILQRKGATVHVTLADPGDNGRPRNTRKLANGTKEYLKTTPTYRIRNARVSVNLRVFLVNHIYQKLRRQGVASQNIIFMSIHMDHLHPSVRGTMVYYPGESMRKSSFKVNSRTYRKFQESRGITYTFTKSENKRAASYSYSFSRKLISAFKKKGVPVHSYRPIRPFVYRKNQRWTPAVIRYCKVPTSVLIEVVNMANRRDLSNIQSYRFREKVAEAIAAAIL